MNRDGTMGAPTWRSYAGLMLALGCLFALGWRAGSGGWGRRPRPLVHALAPLPTAGLDMAKSKSRVPPGTRADLDLTLLSTDPYITPIGILPGPDGIFVADNMSGWIGRVRPGRVSDPLNDRSHLLYRPRAMSAANGEIVVLDDPGIEVFDRSQRFLRRIEPALSFFAFTAMESGGFAINPFVHGEQSPMITLLDATGKRQASFSPPGLQNAGQRAVLASCGGQVFAAQTDEPGAWVLTVASGKAIGIHPPYPDASGLAAGAATLFRPGLLDLAPVFAAGAACHGGRFYLLADYPRPLLFEYNAAGEQIAVHTTTKSYEGFHFLGLAVAIDKGKPEFYSATTDADRKYWLGRFSPSR